MSDMSGGCSKRYDLFSISCPEELRRYSIPIDLMMHFEVNPSSPDFKKVLEDALK